MSRATKGAAPGASSTRRARNSDSRPGTPGGLAGVLAGGLAGVLA
ncbi:hypothetical protein [Pararhodobacter aggregans]|nr:hypothetical protein [Pararhodobacter aggregans]